MDSNQLLDDLIEARYDLMDLARAHGLTPAQLAERASQPGCLDTMRTLCVVADVQTQLMLSRYRLAAAGKLGALASPSQGGDDTTPPPPAELTRRACVDLLKLDLKRAAPPDEVDADANAPLWTREQLYGEQKHETPD